ncbi:hypothetical protein D1007_43111 [Hordeum vulgare]|nr:hypothetical protein D1007_43111 [Hordeum vulgare]
MTGREIGNRVNRVEGGGEGRIGRGGGRFRRGGGRDRGGGGGGRNMVWMRDIDDGGHNSSNMNPRHGPSDKARWEATAMEAQGVAADPRTGATTSTRPWLAEPRAVDSKICDSNKAPIRLKTAATQPPAKGMLPHLCKKNQKYSMQSLVTSNENTDVIPTPPVPEEVHSRFSKRTTGVNMEHVGIMAEKMAKKRNLQGNETSTGNSFEVLSNLEIISTAAQMGVNIPDDNFVVVDIIRELEKSRANIAKTIYNNEKRQEKMLFITNAARESSPLNTSWVDEGDLDDDGFITVKSRRKEKRKVNVVISKPVTRNQNQKLSGIAGKIMAPR